MIRLRLVPEKTTIGFMAWRRPAMGVSAVVFLLALVALVVPGPNFGIDFKGGLLIEVKTPQAADLPAMRGRLGSLGLGDLQLQTFGADNDVLIRVQSSGGEAEAEAAQQAAIDSIRTSLAELHGEGVEYRRIEYVGPQVSQELIEAGVTAMLLAMAMMLLYIWFRFEWHFGVGAVVALLHDVIIAMGILCALQVDFSLPTIAALLTIVGYSINDTVVVYDRVRENIRRYKSLPLADLLDLSMNETLARTTMTSLTTLLALVALYFVGGEVLRPFVFTMILGVVIGTYSSIFIASPLLLVLGLERRRSDQQAAAEAGA